MLPQDTRLAELVAAVSMVLLSISMFTCGVVDLNSIYETQEFWKIIIFIFGALQFSSLVLYPKLELLRCIMAWINGSFWIWIAISDISIHLDSTDIAVFILGMANMYAFIVNINLLKHPWAQK
jgi:hypothetical protein